MPESPSLDELITLTAASRLAGVSTTTLRIWADGGQVQAVRDAAGRRLLVRESLARRLAERRVARTAK